MKELNLNIQMDDIKEFDDEKLSPADKFIEILDSAIIGSFQSDDPNRAPNINDKQRRSHWNLMNRLEEHEDGIISINDKSYEFLQDRWKKKKLAIQTLVRPLRKLIQRMDAIIMPDEQDKEDKEDK